LEIGRREFLRLLGITGTAAVAGTWSAHLLLDVPEKVFTRIHSGSLKETWENSMCSRCPGGCGIRVRKIDGIPVKITGNPNYPINRGSVCPLAEAGVEYLFHPDRIKQPMKKIVAKGGDEWVKISWDEALEILTSRLKKIQKDGNPEKLALITSDHNTVSNDLIHHFMTAFGSPNVLNTGYANAFSLPVNFTQGNNQKPAYDFAGADMIINFDLDVLDAPIAPVHFNKIYGSSKAEIVHVSSYRSRTAVKSSAWHPINVGTGAALALGIANVIVRDGTYDKTFINKKTFGFNDWKDSKGLSHIGFKQLVLTEYSPEKVATITGVASEDIIDLARKFAESEKSFAIGGGQSIENTNGSYTQFAIYCLNALKGNLNRAGGVLFPEMDYLPASRHQLMDQAPDGFLEGSVTLENVLNENKDHSENIDTLILHRSNLLLSGNQVFNARKLLKQVPFVVAINSFMNESTAEADLILPEPSNLESWDASLLVQTVDFPHFGVQKPVIQPIDDTRQFSDVLLSVGKSLNPDMAKKLPWKDFPAFIKTYAQSIYNTGSGAIVSESVDYSWVKFLKERGWQPAKYSSFNEFWNLLLEEGGWWNPGYSLKKNKFVYKNKSGKFEFFSSFLANKYQDNTSSGGTSNSELSILLNDLKIEARGDYVYLPHFEKPGENTNNYPVQLMTFWTFGNWDQSGAKLGLVQEMAGLVSREYWNPWAEINPQTAGELGIIEDEFVDIITNNRSITVRAKLRPTVMPDSVVVPLGKFFGSHASNVRELLSPEMDLLSGIGSMNSTKVRIRKSNHRNQV